MLRVTEPSLEEDILKFPAKETRVFFTLGYILRIIPFVNIVGFLLTSIGWSKLSSKLGSKNYSIAFIASLIMLIVTAYATLISAPTLFSAFSATTINQSATLTDVKTQMLEMVQQTRREMLDPMKYGVNLVLGIALFIEIIGLRQLVRDTRKVFPGYIAILFILLGALMVIEALLHPLLAGGLEEVEVRIMNAQSLADINAVLFYMIAVLAPLIIVGILVFVFEIIAYVLSAYKYWKIYDFIKRVKIILGEESLRKTRREERGERETLL